MSVAGWLNAYLTHLHSSNELVGSGARLLGVRNEFTDIHTECVSVYMHYHRDVIVNKVLPSLAV